MDIDVSDMDIETRQIFTADMAVAALMEVQDTIACITTFDDDSPLYDNEQLASFQSALDQRYKKVKSHLSMMRRVNKVAKER